MRHPACLNLRGRSPRISGLIVNEDDPNEEFSLLVPLFGVQLSDPYSKTVSTILEKKSAIIIFFDKVGFHILFSL